MGNTWNWVSAPGCSGGHFLEWCGSVSPSFSPLFFPVLYLISLQSFFTEMINQVTHTNCYLMQSICLTHSEAKQPKMSEFGAEKIHCRAMGGKWIAHTSKTPNSLKGFSKALLKAGSGRGVASYCKLPCAGILCSYSCLGRSGYNAAVNLQLYKRKSKGQRLEMGYPVYFRL